MYDQFFDIADSDRSGVLKGAAAVPFLSKSGLDRLQLKQVGALAVVLVTCSSMLRC